MLQQIGSHARYIQSVLRGTAREDSASTPDYVKRSWLRCLGQYHLDPQSQREPFVCLARSAWPAKSRTSSWSLLPTPRWPTCTTSWRDRVTPSS